MPGTVFQRILNFLNQKFNKKEIEKENFAFYNFNMNAFAFLDKTVSATTKTSYLFSPDAFDELYDKVMDDTIDSSEILAEFEKRKIIETL